MIGTEVFRLGDYELNCSAKACDDGHFEPALVISRHVWPSRPQRIVLRQGTHPTAELAIESAHAQGVECLARLGRE